MIALEQAWPATEMEDSQDEQDATCPIIDLVALGTLYIMTAGVELTSLAHGRHKHTLCPLSFLLVILLPGCVRAEDSGCTQRLMAIVMIECSCCLNTHMARLTRARCCTLVMRLQTRTRTLNDAQSGFILVTLLELHWQSPSLRREM